jgi:hypothetical protein
VQHTTCCSKNCQVCGEFATTDIFYNNTMFHLVSNVLWQSTVELNTSSMQEWSLRCEFTRTTWKIAWFQASTVKQQRTAPFWIITQWVL